MQDKKDRDFLLINERMEKKMRKIEEKIKKALEGRERKINNRQKKDS